jgi:hypothetical protein
VSDTDGYDAPARRRYRRPGLEAAVVLCLVVWNGALLALTLGVLLP